MSAAALKTTPEISPAGKAGDSRMAGKDGKNELKLETIDEFFCDWAQNLAQERKISFSQALSAAYREAPGLARLREMLYMERERAKHHAKTFDADGNEIFQEIEAAVRAAMKERPALFGDYHKALNVVLSERADLRERYFRTF